MSIQNKHRIIRINGKPHPCWCHVVHQPGDMDAEIVEVDVDFIHQWAARDGKEWVAFMNMGDPWLSSEDDA